MAEHINNSTPLASGGHVWIWGDLAVTRKRLATVGVKGEWSMVLNQGARPGRIAARDGGPAVLKATAATKALADAALNAIEAAIELLVAYGSYVPWEDDQGHTGTALVLMAYRRSGNRQYGIGATATVWQKYTLEFMELAGGF